MASVKEGPAAPKELRPGVALPEDFVPNEPTRKSNEPNLGPDQVSRAADEALLALRPQPSADEITKVLAALSGRTFGSALDAGKAAVDELNRLRTA